MPLLLEDSLGNADRLLAAVVNIRPVVFKQAAAEIHPKIRGNLLQENGGGIASEGVSGKARIAAEAAARIVVEAGFIVLKRTVKGIDPGIAIGQNGGFPAAETAVFSPHPVGGGEAYAASVAGKVNAVKKADPVLVPILGPHLDSGGKTGSLAAGLGAGQVKGAAGKNQWLGVGDGGKLDIHHILRACFPCQLVDEGLEGLGIGQVRIFRVIVIGLGGRHREGRADADGILICHAQVPHKLNGTCAVPAVVNIAYHGDPGKFIGRNRLGSCHRPQGTAGLFDEKLTGSNLLQEHAAGICACIPIVDVEL